MIEISRFSRDNHANFVPNFTDIGIETKYFNKILEEMATIYARLINQYKYNYHEIFSASFCKKNEEDQRGDEIELFINLKISNNLPENDFDKIDVKSYLKHQIQNQETKESGWIFYKINSIKIRFYETGKINGSSFVKFHLRSNGFIKFYN